LNCRLAAVQFLAGLLNTGTILIDQAGAIQAEYRLHLRPSGQPGVGDRFYREILNSAPRLIERVDLPMRDNNQYADLPQLLIDAGFDPSDRKFAALASREKVPVFQATDSDWLQHRATLEACGIQVRYLCGDNRNSWFTNDNPQNRPSPARPRG
jgi:hypothetical protein